MKMCLASLVIKGIQIKTMRYHFRPTRMTVIQKAEVTRVGENVKKLESSYFPDENVKWCSNIGKQFGNSSNC